MPARRVLMSVQAWYRQHRFASLFVVQMLAIGTHRVDATVAGGKLIDLLLALSLFAAIASVVQERGMRVTIVLGAAFVVVRSVQEVLGLPALLPFSESLWGIACVLATVATVRYALRPGRVDVERIFAALDAYLIAGLVFAIAYFVIDHASPGSFRPGPLMRGDAIYFSFITIATLGYGDIVPVNGAARGLVMLEGISGQMYGGAVARLVSLYSREE
jgi:hypothetical protein